MASKQASLIATVYNEASSIADFVRSIFAQSRQPDEVVIVDGGSTDGTPEIIRGSLREMETGVPVRLFVHKTNRSEGRNLAIRAAAFEIIAVTDAGCRLHADWLSLMLEPFENPAIDVVAGGYIPEGAGPVGESLALLATPSATALRTGAFLPSSRSIAFRKRSWETVGGYPEWLPHAAEDTFFDLALRRAGFTFASRPNAVVYWDVPQTLGGVWRQAYIHGFGDGQGGLWLAHHTRNLLISAGGVAVLVAGIRFPSEAVLVLGLTFGFLCLHTLLLGRGKKLGRRTRVMLPIVRGAVFAAATGGFLHGLSDRWIRRAGARLPIGRGGHYP